MSFYRELGETRIKKVHCVYLDRKIAASRTDSNGDKEINKSMLEDYVQEDENGVNRPLILMASHFA